jgi:hypothetical protein
LGDLVEYTFKNGSGETIKLNIIVTPQPFNSKGQALQIDPRSTANANDAESSFGKLIADRERTDADVSSSHPHTVVAPGERDS